MTATRVLNPSVLAEFCLVRSLSTFPRSGERKINHIQRNLFGVVNSTETTKIFNEEMDKHQESAKKKWGFDFRSGTPISQHSPYSWERVSFKESVYTPEVYTLTRAAHIRPSDIQNEASSFELLLDERAERENFSISFAVADNEADSYEKLLSETSSDDVVDVPITHSERHFEDHFKEPTLTLSSAKTRMCLKNRQPKITEYMKERKRLAQTPRKMSPSKRMRTASGQGSGKTIQPYLSSSCTLAKYKNKS